MSSSEKNVEISEAASPEAVSKKATAKKAPAKKATAKKATARKATSKKATSKKATTKKATAKKTTRKKATRKKANPAATEALVEPDMSRPVRPYSLSESYQVGDRIEHSSFGTGIVDQVRGPRKIQVFFEGGHKLLVHERQPRSH